MKWFSKVIYDAYPEGQDFPIYGGSTKDLKRRQKEHRKSHPDWFGKGILKEVRKVEGWFETESSFDAYVAVVEQAHIIDRGYEDALGENQVLPVDAYLNGFCPTFEMRRKAGLTSGPIQGRKNAENGHMQAIGKFYGLIQGQKNVESGHIQAIAALARTPEHQRMAGQISNCFRWQIQRGKPCVCGRHELPKVA